MRFLIFFLLTFVVGCSEPKRRETACPREPATFRLELTAVDADLPLDTVLVVNYQATFSEQYALAHPASDNEDVCCRPGPAMSSGPLPAVPCGALPMDSGVPMMDSGSATDSGSPSDSGFSADSGGSSDSGARMDSGPATNPGGRRALFCELWTGGATELSITASGYAPFDETLNAVMGEDEECGWTTLDVHLTLMRPEGGVE
jgi:hypothetical protein